MQVVQRERARPLEPERQRKVPRVDQVEVVHQERVGDAAQPQRIRRCHCHDPSWQNWPVLEHAVIGNIVPDFPLINKSFNLSYSGHDL